MTSVASVVAQADANLLKVVTKLLKVKFQSVDRKLTLQVGGAYDTEVQEYSHNLLC